MHGDAGRSRAGGRPVAVPRGAPVHAYDRHAAACLAQPAAIAARAGTAAGRRARRRRRGGQRLRRPEPLHAAFQTDVRRAARALAGELTRGFPHPAARLPPRRQTPGQPTRPRPQEHTSRQTTGPLSSNAWRSAL
ncbi:hypothetical protein EMIT0111MI5_160156 [Burkholderia sp. IT-111MI5]